MIFLLETFQKEYGTRSYQLSILNYQLLHILWIFYLLFWVLLHACQEISSNLLYCERVIYMTHEECRAELFLLCIVKYTRRRSMSKKAVQLFWKADNLSGKQHHLFLLILSCYFWLINMNAICSYHHAMEVDCTLHVYCLALFELAICHLCFKMLISPLPQPKMYISLLWK